MPNWCENRVRISTRRKIMDTNNRKLGSVDEDELLSVNEVGIILGVSKPTVYDLLHHGVLNSMYIGRLRKVPRSSLKQYIKEQMIKGQVE